MTDLDASTPPSVRSAGDSWSITELVGATALGVAASRAAETAGADPLIRDEFARLLVSSAGPAWARLADPELSWLADDQHGGARTEPASTTRPCAPTSSTNTSTAQCVPESGRR